jgi:tetratricopeptide (TPR) repeat protein
MRKTLHQLLAMAVVLLVGSASLLAGEKKLPLTSSSEKAIKHYWQARKALEETNFQAIAGHVQSALKADPNFAFALMLQSARQQNPQALETLKKALELAQTDGEKRYIEATLTYRNGDIPGAIEQLESLLEDFPGDRGTWMFVAQLQQAVNRLDDAEKSFKTAMKLDGSTFRVYQLLSQVYTQNNKTGKAREILKKAQKIDGTEQQVLTSLGTLELLDENYGAARKYYKKAADMVDRDASPFLPFFGQAWTYVYEGKPDAALEIVDEYMARYNRNGAAQGFPPVWIWNHKGRINMEFGNVEEAIRCYETGCKSVNPAPEAAVDSVNKIVWLGRCQYGKARGLARMGKHEEAWAIVNKFKKMIDENPEQGNQYLQAHHYMAGYLYNESGEYAKAIEHLKQATPTDPFHTLLLARAYEKSGDLENAKAAYEKVTQMRVNNIERALSYPEAKKKLAMLSSSN